MMKFLDWLLIGYRSMSHIPPRKLRIPKKLAGKARQGHQIRPWWSD